MAKSAALIRTGTDRAAQCRAAGAERPAASQSNITQGPWTAGESGEAQKDHFISRNGKLFAGTHLIIDLWGASRLDDLDHVRETLVEAVRVAGATLLHIHLHHFTPNGGISGVAVLAESHISIHSWPERGYAALDVFMCGDAQPMKAIPVLERAFTPSSIKCDELLRGEIGK